MRFREGDIVKISKKSIFYGNAEYGSPNPMDMEGEVSSTSGNALTVRWDNGEVNGYGEKDLGLVRRADA